MSFKSLKSRFLGTPEEKFWYWFQANEEMIYYFEKDQENALEKIHQAIKKVHPDLVFEISGVHDAGKREFVISAGGLSEVISAVESLHAKAPQLDRWIFIKYRQRRIDNPAKGIKFEGRLVSGEGVKYSLIKDEDPQRIGVLLFFPNYSENDSQLFANVGFLLLDHMLGEYNVMTRVGYIDFLSTESEHCESSMPLAELPSQFDHYFSNLN